MSLRKGKRSAGAAMDPTIPDVAVEVGGRKIRLCFDFGALAAAKAKLREFGVQVNVLRIIDFTSLDVDTLPALFYAAAYRFQPELTWQDATAMVTVRTVESIAVALFAAYKVAMMEPDKNPQRAPDSKA